VNFFVWKRKRPKKKKSRRAEKRNEREGKKAKHVIGQPKVGNPLRQGASKGETAVLL